MKKITILTLLLSVGFSFLCLAQKQKPRVLIFSKTVRYYHESIPSGIAAIIKLGQQNGFEVDTTKKSAFSSNLGNFEPSAAVNSAPLQSISA